jgi:transcriptional regulator with XRE-family HTH domain
MARRPQFSRSPFGETVQALMAETGMTYRILAERSGLSAGYLHHLVHGNRPVPSNEVLGSVAKALGVEADHFREYRVRFVTEHLEGSPQLADRLYRRLSA